MSLTEVENSEELRNEFEDIDEYIQQQEEQDRKGRFAGWGISFILHLIILLILGLIVTFNNFENDEAPIRVVILESPEPLPEPEDVELIEPDQVVTHEEVVTHENTIITDIEIEIEEISTEDNISESEQPKGREDAVSSSEMGGSGAFMAIGANGGSSGAFGRVVGGDRNKIGRAFGPNARAVSSIIDSALRWLMIHQSPNGQWDSDNYFINCQVNPKMESGNEVNGADEALSGYAILCFLGAGYDHRTPSKFRKTVDDGIDWLISQQNDNGVIGRRNYEHPIATMALAEAYAMTMDPNLREPVQRAVNVILERQVQDANEYPLGWNYVQPTFERQDSSVTGWNVMALKSAKVAGLNVGDGLLGSKRWLELAWQAANPEWENLSDPYEDTSVFPYVWNGATNETKKDHLSFVGVMCGVFLDEDGIMLQSMANDMTDRWFHTNKYRQNSYALYYASLGAFQMGQRHWRDTWGNPDTGYAPWLIETFVEDEQEGCRKGTWIHENERWHGHDTSPILLHVYKLLALEVAIRYEVVRDK